MFTEAVPVKHIHFILRVRCRSVEAHCLQCLVRLRCIRVCHPGLRLAESHLPGPAAEVALVIPVEIVRRFDAAVGDSALRDPAVLVGHMEKAAVSEVLSPAVHAEERSVRFRGRCKFFFRIVVIPSDDHRVMVRFFAAFVADILITHPVF